MHAFMLRNLLPIDTNLWIQGQVLNYLIPLGSPIFKREQWKLIINKLVSLKFSSHEENHCNIMIVYVINLTMDHIDFLFGFNTKQLYSTFWNVFIFLVKRRRCTIHYDFHWQVLGHVKNLVGLIFCFSFFPFYADWMCPTT